MEIAPGCRSSKQERGDEKQIMDLKLKKKTALVTGSTAGIGFAIARLLAAEGADVVITGRNRERVDKALEALADSGVLLRGIEADLGTASGTATVIDELAQVDILVNNVGIYEPKDFFAIEDESWTKMFEVNVMSGVRLSRHYLKNMLNNNWGRVLFISSESGVNIPAEMIHYGMSKTAQIAVARGLAELTTGTGVTVNSVLPGPTRSEGVEDFIRDMARSNGITEEAVEQDFFEKIRPSSLIKRFASCEEVANMVAYLSSDLASATNGAAIRVEGGCIRSAI